MGETGTGTQQIASRGRLQRRNLAVAAEEYWRPPVFSPAAGPVQKFGAAVRRFFDLQAGSLWNDLERELSQATGTVLDVGCGAQPYRSLLPDHVQYLGIDTCDAKERFGYAMPDTLYFTGGTWPVDASSVDMVLCAEVLEHVIAPANFAHEIERCLRPGGRLVLTVPFAARWHFVPYDYYRYTPSGLKLILEEAGFNEIVVLARGNPLSVACYKIMALLLPLLFSRQSNACITGLTRLLGIAALPFLVVVALIANITLSGDWGEDCLGYTVTARCKTASAE